MPSETRCMFGPLEPRALLMGLRGQQVTVFGVTLLLLLVLAAMWTAAPPINVGLAFLLAGTAAAVCFVPMGGRTVEQWAPGRPAVDLATG
jgi:hypothetical protein